MPEPEPDPFEGLVLDDAFVAAAAYAEPRMVRAPGRWSRARRGRRIGLAVQTALALGTALAVAVWAPTGAGTAGSSRPADRTAPRTSTGQLPVPQPWNDPVPELDVRVGP